MKKFLLLIAIFLFVNELKAQHIEVDDFNSASSLCVEKPTVWLDGDSVRYSFVVTFPTIGIELNDVSVWLDCNGQYDYDLFWHSNVRPSDVIVTYSGARYVGDLVEGNWYDIDYGASLESDTEIYGVNSLISFAYYSY